MDVFVYGERNKNLVCYFFYCVCYGVMVFVVGGNVQKCDFVCVLFVIVAGYFNGIVGIMNIDKLYVFYYVVIVYIQIGNNVFC